MDSARELTFEDEQIDYIFKQADMLFRNVFDQYEDEHFFKDLYAIKFKDSSNKRTGLASSVFLTGKNQLITLLKVTIKHLELKYIESDEKPSKRHNTSNSRKVFIVHGHNEGMKQSVARTVEKLKLEPIILHEQPNKGNTIIEKFEEYSDVTLAIVILSADDAGYSEKEGAQKVKPRARQNVIFELGYFIGKLGRDRVLALFETRSNYELPSDYSGVLFVPYDEKQAWKYELVREMKLLGMEVNANDIL